LPWPGQLIPQILLEDPSGNAVELFEPVVLEARLSPSG
jgi:hypothetical protein